jgi:hypothetical protein
VGPGVVEDDLGVGEIAAAADTSLSARELLLPEGSPDTWRTPGE